MGSGSSLQGESRWINRNIASIPVQRDSRAVSRSVGGGRVFIKEQEMDSVGGTESERTT